MKKLSIFFISIVLIAPGLTCAAELIDPPESQDYIYYVKEEKISHIKRVNERNIDLVSLIDDGHLYRNQISAALNPQMTTYHFNHSGAWENLEKETHFVSNDYLYKAVDWDTLLELNEMADTVWKNAGNRYENKSELIKAYKELLDKRRDQFVYNKKEKKSFSLFRKKDERLKDVSLFLDTVKNFLESSDVYNTYGFSFIDRFHPLFSDALFEIVENFQDDIFRNNQNHFSIDANKREYYYFYLHQLPLHSVNTLSYWRGIRLVKENRHQISDLKVVSSAIFLLSMRMKSCSSGIISRDQSYLSRFDYSYRFVSWTNLHDWLKQVFDYFYAFGSNSTVFCKRY
ncbi:hypothetical protein HBN50_12690 [Halobacteriovorax sp. GB3]|uniref:hypothetical protein n=1 Tax=Halobacteriovorax sp. GB3 TaxID=2719615 RepID=UPI0023631005|nr:hypothetical protein [Halobacteriovorax sp. GB3]MDD0853962.1 hypothetical protein [Halobacteriovorax sp. GB3]